MKRYVVAGMFALVLSTPLTALATAQRTFAASTGSDANPCTLTQPCRSFAIAVAKTSTNGEVIVLDSAGYGPFTITQSISIIAPRGVYAGITVFSGDGITINGSGIVVALRGLSINGQGGVSGIAFLQGAALFVERCEISNLFASGIDLSAVDSHVAIQDTVIGNIGFTGVNTHQGSGVMRVSIANSVIEYNQTGVRVSSTAGALQLTIARSILTRNENALEVSAIAGASASILSDGNTITYADKAFSFFGSGGSEAIFTPGNNTVGYIGIPVSGGALTLCCGM